MLDITNTVHLRDVYNTGVASNDISKVITTTNNVSFLSADCKLDVNYYFAVINTENGKIKTEEKKSLDYNSSFKKIANNLESYIQTKINLATLVNRPHFPELKAYNSIVANLKAFGLSESEYIYIEKFINIYKSAIENAGRSIHIKRGIFQLPRSIVYMASGKYKGWHVLLKTHGNVDEDGVGGDSRVTSTIYLNTGKKKAFRSTAAICVSEQEIIVNDMLENVRPDLFATGTPIFYNGPCRQRRGRFVGDRDSFRDTRIENVFKIGMVMDHFEKRDLQSQFYNLDFKQKVYVMAKTAEGLAVMHELGWVHRDVKATNILLDGKFNSKITDFGMACKYGEIVNAEATPGHESPEVLVAQARGEDYIASRENDYWSFGVTMMTTFFGNVWYKKWSKMPNNAVWQLNGIPSQTISVLGHMMTDPYLNMQTAEVVLVIARCLALDPGKRMTSTQAANSLYKIYNVSASGTYPWVELSDKIMKRLR